MGAGPAPAVFFFEGRFGAGTFGAAALAVFVRVVFRSAGVSPAAGSLARFLAAGGLRGSWEPGSFYFADIS